MAPATSSLVLTVLMGVLLVGVVAILSRLEDWRSYTPLSDVGGALGERTGYGHEEKPGGLIRWFTTVDHKDIGFLSKGDRCLVTFPESGTEVEGTVLRLHPEPDYQRGLYTVDVQMPPDLSRQVGDARIGRFVRVAFLTRPYTGLLIPKPALTEEGARSSVFLVVDGAAVRKAVELGAEYPEGVAVREGLSAGDEVILSPPPGLQEGTPVAVEGEVEDGQ